MCRLREKTEKNAVKQQVKKSMEQRDLREWVKMLARQGFALSDYETCVSRNYEEKLQKLFGIFLSLSRYPQTAEFFQFVKFFVTVHTEKPQYNSILIHMVLTGISVNNIMGSVKLLCSLGAEVEFLSNAFEL